MKFVDLSLESFLLFTKEMLVAEPLLDSMTEEMNVLILHKRSEML